MNVEVGQYISDGVNDLLVCAKDYYEGKFYVYLLDEKEDNAFFCEVKKNNDIYEFIREQSPSQIQQLIIHFSKIKDMIKGDANGKL